MKHRNNSYIVINKATGNPVLEFFNEGYKKHINTEKHIVMTAAEYLSTLNEKTRAI